MMKIAIYQPRVSYYVGGGEIVPLQHAHYLNELGHHVTLLTTRASFINRSNVFKEFVKANPSIDVEYIDLPDSLRWISETLPTGSWERWDTESIYVAKLAIHKLSSTDYDLVAVHNYLDILGVPPDKKSVSHLHGYPEKPDYLHKLVVNMPNEYVAASDYIENRWQQMLDIRNIRTATNGIDSQTFLPLNIEKRYDLLYVGRLIKIKGVDYLLRAIKALEKNNIGLRVAIAGQGPEKEYLVQLANELQLDSVEFLDYVKVEDMVRLYNSSKISVFPSFDREGILTTMLESSSCGTPVITTTACSMKEYIKNNVNGLLIRPRDVEALSRAIKSLLEDTSLRSRISAATRKDITQNWTWETKIREVENIYHGIINSN